MGEDHDADVIVRLNRVAVPLVDGRDQQADRRRALGAHARERPRCRASRSSAVLGRRSPEEVEGGLIGTRLPDDKIADAERRVRESQDRNVSDKARSR